MAKTPILATGLSGLVGSRLAHDFADVYDFQNLDLSDSKQPVDITDIEQLQKVFHHSPAKTLVHFAAFTDVTKAWEQRDDKNGLAYRVNVLGTKNIVKAAEETSKHIIHISTAYVFDGQKDNMYVEEDPLHPIEWYGQTKAWAEDAVYDAKTPWTILRIDQPFRPDQFPRPDTAHRIIEGIKNGALYPQFTNHYFGPTYIPDLAKAIDWVIRTNATGIFHATGGESWTDYDFASAINEKLQLGGEVKKGDLDQYLKTLSRPYQRNTALDSAKLKKVIDFQPLDVKEAIGQIQI